MRLRILTVALATCGLWAAAASADVVRSGTVINNTVGEFSGSFSPNNLFDQGGLSSIYISGVTDFDVFNPNTVVNTTFNNPGSDQEFYSANGTPGFTDFDLGASYDVRRLAIWDHARTGNGNATSSFNVYVSNDASFAGAASLGTFTLANNGLDSGSTGQVFDFADTIGRYVRIEHLTTQGGGLFGAGELAFGTAAVAVPEPAGLMAAGLIGLIAVGRRRRRSA